jgi:hypothetical protein
LNSHNSCQLLQSPRANVDECESSAAAAAALFSHDCCPEARSMFLCSAHQVPASTLDVVVTDQTTATTSAYTLHNNMVDVEMAAIAGLVQQIHLT